MDELYKTIVTILASVGGIGIIILGLSSWLGKVWADKIYLKTNARHEKELEELRNRYNTELEQLRAEISGQRDLRNTTLNALASGYTSAHKHILPSLEALWNKIIETRDFASSVLFVYDILKPEEYKKLSADGIANFVPEVKMSVGEFGDRFSEFFLTSIEGKRPYIGEKLWLISSTYNAFAMRLVWKIWRRKKILEWDKDVEGETDIVIYNLLRTAFTEAELAIIINTIPSGAPRRILGAIESKILSEMNELIFGRRLIDISVEEHQRITEALFSIRRVAE